MLADFLRSTLVLTSTRAAEISTGLICVCIPTLAALVTRPHSLKPTRSIVNGEYNSRHGQLSGKRPPPSLDEQNLFDRVDIELQEDNFNATGLRIPESVVVTGIEGGNKRPSILGIQDGGSVDSHEERDERTNGMGIMKTVRIEQSYL